MDILIAVLLGATQVASGLLGTAISMKEYTGGRRYRVMALFGLLSLLGLVLIGWQAVRASEGNEAVKRTMLGDAERPPFIAVLSMPGHTRFVVTNPSDYPAFSVRVKLYDEACRNGGPIRSYEYAELRAHGAVIDPKPWVPIGNAPEQRFTASIETRAGLARQEMILRKVESNQWMRASRVMDGMRLLDLDIDSSWPRNDKGEVDW